MVTSHEAAGKRQKQSCLVDNANDHGHSQRKSRSQTAIDPSPAGGETALHRDRVVESNPALHPAPPLGEWPCEC